MRNQIPPSERFGKDPVLDTPDTWTRAYEHSPRLVPDFSLTFEKTALMIIDMQNQEVNPQLGLAKIIHDEYPAIRDYLFPRMNQVVVPNTERLLQAFRNAGLPPVFVMTAPLLPDGSDMFWLRRMRDSGRKTGYTHPIAGSAAATIISQLSPRERELVVQKNSGGVFNSTAIDQILRNMEISELVITGVATDGCVEMAARDAADRGYRCYLVEDACATNSVRQQQATMEAFVRSYGKVKRTDEVLEELQAARVPISDSTGASAGAEVT